MLLSGKAITNIQNMFKVPDRTILDKYESEKEGMEKLTTYINNQINKDSFTNKNTIFQNPTTQKRLSFPVYDIGNQNIINVINNDDYYFNYPLSNELIIDNPEEVIQSGYMKGSINANNVPDEKEENPNKAETKASVYDIIDDYKKLENTKIINPEPQQLETNLDNNNNLTVSNLIPGKLAETVILPNSEEHNDEEQNIEEPKIEEVKEEIPVPVVQNKKYQITTKSNDVVVLPQNYGTDDDDEYTAITSLNEGLSAYKQYKDEPNFKIYFKPFAVKDEKGKDLTSVIGYSEIIFNYPAKLLIDKLIDFSFCQKFDDNYKKGKLISEKMIDGNIKMMEMYLYMKFPFVFSDRDFVVQRKCWLDYNGNKDHALSQIHSIEHPDYPPNKKLVRGEYVNMTQYIQPLGDNKCKLNMVNAMDFKMSLGLSMMSKEVAQKLEKWYSGLTKELAALN